MTWWWKSLFRKRALDTQLSSEVRFHIEELTDANIAGGDAAGRSAAQSGAGVRRRAD